jgi:hypothetical protein
MAGSVPQRQGDRHLRLTRFERRNHSGELIRDHIYEQKPTNEHKPFLLKLSHCGATRDGVLAP